MVRWSWFAFFCFAAVTTIAAPEAEARRRLAPFQKGAAGKAGKPFKPPPKPAKGGYKSGKYDPFASLASKAAQKKKDFASLFGKKPGFGSFGKGKAGKPKIPPKPAGKGSKSGGIPAAAASARRAAAGKAPAPKSKGARPKPKGSRPSGRGWNKPMPNGKRMPKGLNDTQIKDLHERQEKQFKLMDADEDGVVTTDEVSKMREKLKNRQTDGGKMEQFESTLLKKTDKDDWHTKGDKNGDGHLTLDEFKFKRQEPKPQEL